MVSGSGDQKGLGLVTVEAANQSVSVRVLAELLADDGRLRHYQDAAQASFVERCNWAATAAARYRRVLEDAALKSSPGPAPEFRIAAACDRIIICRIH
jgi:hypothetical protein